MEKQETYTDEELLFRIESDMEAEGIAIRKSSRDEILDNPLEWKIAVMNCDTDDKYYDFHFLRQNPRNGKWYQKQPDEQHATCQDRFYRVITDPADARFFYNYHLVGYYVLAVRDY